MIQTQIYKKKHKTMQRQAGFSIFENLEICNDKPEPKPHALLHNVTMHASKLKTEQFNPDILKKNVHNKQFGQTSFYILSEI